jgi:tetrahydromethanopterin S-methyltransferase subunit B
MSDKNLQQAIFTDVEKVVEAIDLLRNTGIAEEEIEVLSGMPFSHHILGRKEVKSMVPVFAIVGFIVGLVISLLLNFGTPILYPVYVGGKPLLSTPPTLILTFEISMLGLMVFSFFGAIWESRLPKYEEIPYSPKVSEGKIALLFPLPESGGEQVAQGLKDLGAEVVGEVEVMG